MLLSMVTHNRIVLSTFWTLNETSNSTTLNIVIQLQLICSGNYSMKFLVQCLDVWSNWLRIEMDVKMLNGGEKDKINWEIKTKKGKYKTLHLDRKNMVRARALELVSVTETTETVPWAVPLNETNGNFIVLSLPPSAWHPDLISIRKFIYPNYLWTRWMKGRVGEISC